MSSQEFKFHVEMTCEGCSGAAKRVLDKLGEAVSEVVIDLEGKTVTVTTTLSQDEIFKTLEKTGKKVELL